MQGASRGSLTTGQHALAQVLSTDIDRGAVGEQLFAVGRLLGGSAQLRRAFTDPSRADETRRELADKLLGGKVSEQVLELVRVAAGSRWAQDRDLVDALDQLGVEAILSAAEQQGRLDQVEDELFRFERTVARDTDLRDALGDRRRAGADKAELVGKLLEGRAAPETVALARQAAANPGGRRVEQVLQSYVEVAARLRERLIATVTAAVNLSDEQRQRLAAALQRIYDRPVQVNVLIDPDVVGGLRIQVGDEVIDGTIASRLQNVRRELAG